MIRKYFKLNEKQAKQFDALDALYRDWNAKINVISRKDIDNLYLHHVLHSLAIAKVLDTEIPMKVLDFGTGGGFPGIPLAIMHPEMDFRMIDSIGKKVKVAKAIGDAIGLTNCEYEHIRGQEDKGHYNLIVSRAVMPLKEIRKIFKHTPIMCLKGGDLTEELEGTENAEVIPVSSFFDEEWFKDKYIIYLPSKK